MKYLLKLFVKSLLSPPIAALYIGLTGLIFMQSMRFGLIPALICFFVFIGTVAFLGLIHAARRAAENEESEALIKNN